MPEYHVVELNVWVKMQVSTQNPYSWDAYREAYEAIKEILEKDPRVRQVGTEGIRTVYTEEA